MAAVASVVLKALDPASELNPVVAVQRLASLELGQSGASFFRRCLARRGKLANLANLVEVVALGLALSHSHVGVFRGNDDEIGGDFLLYDVQRLPGNSKTSSATLCKKFRVRTRTGWSCPGPRRRRRRRGRRQGRVRARRTRTGTGYKFD